MFSSAKIIFKNLIFFCLLTFIASECYIDLPDNTNIKPDFYIYAGRNRIKLNTDGKTLLKLHDKQKLVAYCDTRFEEPLYYNEENTVFIKCEHNYLYTAIDINHNIKNNEFGRINFVCSYQNWNLYEAVSDLDWCPVNATSYIVGRSEIFNAITGPFNTLTSICYDVYNLTLHSVYYTVTPKGNDDVQPTALRNFDEPTIRIDHVEEIFRTNRISGNVVEGQFKNWFAISNYNFSSIIQHLKINSSFNDQLGTLLEFLWWPNLRLYNWKRYTDALAEHVEDDNKPYDILAGISGTIKVPFLKSCKENYTMRDSGLKTKKIPLYVWNYLHDRSNSSNDVVIIGFNSPFSEFYSIDDIIFCPDKCEEISWLKNAKSSFRYNIMGIMFCCNVEDVRSSKLLYGFPGQDLKLQPKKELRTSKEVINYEDEEIHFDESAK